MQIYSLASSANVMH